MFLGNQSGRMRVFNYADGQDFHHPPPQPPLNADWRDFESTPAVQEKPENAITLFDYHGLLSETGWKTTHRIECPLSSERLTGNQVQRMQDKRVL